VFLPLSFVQQQSDWLLVRISTLLDIDIMLNGVGLEIAEYQQLCGGESSCQVALLCCLAAKKAALARVFVDTASQHFVYISQNADATGRHCRESTGGLLRVLQLTCK